MMGKIAKTKVNNKPFPPIPLGLWIAADRGSTIWHVDTSPPELDWELIHRISLLEPDFSAIAAEICNIVSTLDYAGHLDEAIEQILRERLS